MCGMDECIGLQPNSRPPTWVVGRNLHVHLVGGVARRISANDSPYAVLGSEMAPLPLIDIKDEDLDCGAALKEVINIQNKYMGENFVPALLTLGGMGVALHYEKLSELFDGVPLIMAYGLPVSGKSLAVHIAMSIIGENTSVGECTQAGMLKLACSRTLPFWWDDVSDFNTLEALTVQTFNQSQKQTAKREMASNPRTVPMMTMNPQCLYRKKKLDKEKISRVFTRIAVIPFEMVSGIQTLKKSLELKAALQPVLKKSVLSVGTLLKLRDDFIDMKEDTLFQNQISPLLEGSSFDMRTQLNYALLLYSIGKILEKVGLTEHFAKVKSFFSSAIVPAMKRLLESDESNPGFKAQEYDKGEEGEFLGLIHKIVEEAIAQPNKIKNFFLPKASMKSKCKCGDVFGFKVSEALQFIAVPEREQALRRFVSETKRGCIGRLTFPGTGQSSGCIHIPRAQLPANMLRSMDEAFSNLKNAPRHSGNVQGNSMAHHSVITISDGNVVADSKSNEGADPQEVSDSNVVADNTSNEGADPHEESSVISVEENIEDSSVLPDQGIASSSKANSSESDDEKMALDNEILARATEQAELEAKAKSEETKKGRKGGKNKVSTLLDNLHPGTIEGKRRRVEKRF